jgi:hypothetical protein
MLRFFRTFLAGVWRFDIGEEEGGRWFDYINS